MRKYKFILYFTGLIFLSNFINITSAHPKKLVQKQVFLYEFPRYLSFHGEHIFVNTDYETWSKSVSQTSGLMKKFISEELVINHQAAEWANRYAANNPEKIVMLHLNGEARQVQDFPEVRKKYFPGHWVYMAGSSIESDLTKKDRVIKVTDIKPFTKKGYIVRKSNPVAYFPLKALLVKLDDNGNKLWYKSEFIEIEFVDKEHNTIQVKRGIYDSKPLDFKAGKSYIAPLAGDHWGKHVMLFYNLSNRCPRDVNGKQAKDIFIEEITSWFMDNGILCNFDGIAFDVNYFDVSRKGADWDVNNDGIADGGWIGGQNVWKSGDIDFLASLRDKLGRDFIISADGQHSHNQQLPSVLNGIESEGLVQHNDMWRGFSRAINTHLYWQGHISSSYDYRYVVMKVMGADTSDGAHMRRFGAATAFCLGASITVPVGEGKKLSINDFIPQEFCREGSLGKPVGDLIRYAECRKPYLVIKGSDLAILEKNCSCEMSGGSMILTLSPSVFDLFQEGEKSEILLKLQNISLPKGDAVFEVKAQILEYDTDLAAKYKVPAVMWFRPDKLPVLGQKIYKEYFDDIYGLFGSEKVEKMTYYFRELDGGNQTVNLRIVGANKIRIDELRIYDAPDVIMRKFEHGAIVVNPSLHPVSLNIGNYMKYKKETIISIPPVDAVYLKSN